MHSGRPRVPTFEEWYPEYVKSMHFSVATSEFGTKEDAYKAVADAAFEAGKAYAFYCADHFNNGL